MGQIISVCCGGQESTKEGLLSSSSFKNSHSSTIHDFSNHSSHHKATTRNQISNENNISTEEDPTSIGANAIANGPNRTAAQAEALEIQRKQAIMKEQARLEQIVSTAGRTMLAIRRRDGYYDPGYAAAKMAELRNNSANINRVGIVNHEFMTLQGKIPKSIETNANVLMNNLNVHQVANTLLEDYAETFLDSLAPTKERLFHGLDSVIENLP